jgi:hypothetical protein
MCHRTGSRSHPFVTISVDRHAVPAHKRHGDQEGACTSAVTTTGTTSATTTGTTAATTSTTSSEHHGRLHREVKCSVVFVRVNGERHHHHHR